MFKELIEKRKQAKQQKREENARKEKEALKEDAIKNFLSFSSYESCYNDFERDACRFAVLGTDIYTQTEQEFGDCEKETSVFMSEDGVLVRRIEYRKDNEVKSRQYVYFDKNFRLHRIVRYDDLILVVDYMVEASNIGEGNNMQRFYLDKLDGLTQEQFKLYKKVANFIGGADAYNDLLKKKASNATV